MLGVYRLGQALGNVGRPREAAGDAMGGNALRYREKLIPIPQCQPIKANRSFVPKKLKLFNPVTFLLKLLDIRYLLQGLPIKLNWGEIWTEV